MTELKDRMLGAIMAIPEIKSVDINWMHEKKKMENRKAASACASEAIVYAVEVLEGLLEQGILTGLDQGLIESKITELKLSILSGAPSEKDIQWAKEGIEKYNKTDLK